MSQISLRGLCKHYAHGGEGASATKMALDHMNLDIGDGERVGVIGANGAGKSTLLQLIAGVSTASSGEIQVEGSVHAALSVGIGLREQLTGRENLYLDAEIQGVARTDLDKQIHEMIEFTELGDFIDRPVRTYSSGMKSRLTFAMLVFVEPEILLVDETLSAGDQFFQSKATDAVRRLCDRGKIVIIVSHGLGSIVEMCSRCIWLHDGKLQMDGEPEAVTSAYREFQRERIEQQVVAEADALRSHWHKPPVRAISPPRLPDGVTLLSGATLGPDDPFSLMVDVDLDMSGVSTDVCVALKIERLDGVLVTRNEYRVDVDRLGDGKVTIRAELERLALGPSYYLAVIEVTVAGDPVATVQDYFHVFTNDPAVGGAPVLYWPSTVAVA
jgi:lipopolysaccharide transport system ATP-binding protein